MANKHTASAEDTIEEAKLIRFAIFRGDGNSYIPSVPTRDLTLAEWEALSEEVRALCLETKLYSIGYKPQEE